MTFSPWPRVPECALRVDGVPASVADVFAAVYAAADAAGCACCPQPTTMDGFADLVRGLPRGTVVIYPGLGEQQALAGHSLAQLLSVFVDTATALSLGELSAKK